MQIGAQSFTIFQDGALCTFSINVAQANFGSAGRTGTIQLTTRQGCSYSVGTNVNWLKVIFILDNLISFNSREFVLFSPKHCNEYSRAEFHCKSRRHQLHFFHLSFFPTFYPICGTGVVSVTSSLGCSWTRTSSAAWINISFGGSGSGGGQVGYTVAANTSPSSRAGTMTIAGQTFTVNQQAAPCVYSLSEAEQSFSSSEAGRAVSVNTANGCPWSASSQSSWITLSSGSSGMGSGAVQYTIEANSGSDLRTGNIIGGRSLKVTQAGADSAPVIVVEPVLVDFGRVARGDTGSQPLKISNKGTAPLTIKGMRITSRTLGVFKSEGGCQTLAPGESCTLTLKLNRYPGGSFKEL